MANLVLKSLDNSLTMGGVFCLSEHIFPRGSVSQWYFGTFVERHNYLMVLNSALQNPTGNWWKGPFIVVCVVYSVPKNASFSDGSSSSRKLAQNKTYVINWSENQLISPGPLFRQLYSDMNVCLSHPPNQEWIDNSCHLREIDNLLKKGLNLSTLL